MEKQIIKITLEEYKELRAIIEDYNTLAGEYNLLKLMYDLRLYPQEEKEVKEIEIKGFSKE